ncbi:hypothetical protein [Streptomyces glaucescens]|uniref:Putative membrane protein n=1 Tax=Streptomyces glaucescens TaxID=1907 RepID=A0A089X4Z7_STRGA|nr:hypothetical protein [Streptomyces glaucescens]AIR98942.1 putative membrane protein [Streptomyces glaucescens]
MVAGSERGVAGRGPARWAVRAAWAVPVGLLPSSLWRVAVAFDAGHTTAERVYMLVLSCLTVGLGCLTVGLVRPWGEVFPRRLPGVGGRAVPARAVTVVARTGGVLLVLLTLYGALNAVFGFVGEGPRLIGQEREFDKPDAWVGWLYLPAAPWGFLLLAVTADYAGRTRAATPARRR